MVVILPTAKQGAQNDFQQIRRTKNKFYKKNTHIKIEKTMKTTRQWKKSKKI